jgi:hypothetical protein
MRLYFSGGAGIADTPEGLVPKRKPMIMPSFFKIDDKDTRDRILVFLNKTKKKQHIKKTQ